MSLVSTDIPSMFNGVSQQPPSLRLPSQAEVQVNGWSSVATGLRKRAPSQHVERLGTADITDAHLHVINRDSSERYLVVVTNGDVEVYDAITGERETVNFPQGKNYLTLSAGNVASSSYSLVTVADYTFIVNKTKEVSLGNPGDDLSLPAGWTNFFLPDGWAVVPGSAPDANYTNPSQTFRGTKQTFSDLPKDADTVPPAAGDVWKVAGFDQDSFGAYYVIRVGSGDSAVWEETVGPNLVNRINEETMPWALVREADGTFSFKPFRWEPRRFGDDESNPPPSFVGKRIRDVFYYRNRLAFVADENVVFSAAGDFGRFWRATVTDLLDDDVVDIAVASAKVSVLNHAVPFNGGLMLFADQTQFALNVDELLTPTSISIDTVTEFSVNTRVRPVGIGNEVYFPTESKNHSRIREYFVQEGDANSTDAADITAHVPRYLPPNVRRLSGSSDEDVLFAISDEPGFENRVYVYKFLWDGDGKAQSSWSYWEMPGENAQVLTLEMLDGDLFLVVSRPEGVFLERMDLAEAATAGDLDFDVLLDRRREMTGVYNSQVDRTVFTFPYDIEAADRASVQIVRGPDFSAPGSLIDTSQYIWSDARTVSVPGSEVSGEVFAGMAYEFRYQLSRPYLRRQGTPVTTGRYQLRTVTVHFDQTAFFETEVAPYGIAPQSEAVVTAGLSSFTGKTLGADSLRLNEPSFHTGTYSFQVYGESEQATVALTNSSHLQCVFQSAEIEGFYHNRARIM